MFSSLANWEKMTSWSGMFTPKETQERQLFVQTPDRHFIYCPIFMPWNCKMVLFLPTRHCVYMYKHHTGYQPSPPPPPPPPPPNAAAILILIHMTGYKTWEIHVHSRWRAVESNKVPLSWTPLESHYKDESHYNDSCLTSQKCCSWYFSVQTVSSVLFGGCTWLLTVIQQLFEDLAVQPTI